MAKKPMSAAHKAAATRAKNRGAAGAKSSPVKGPSNEQQNISVRKIDNGYLVSKGEYHRGQYVERQIYTPSKPQIQIANAPKAKS